MATPVWKGRLAFGMVTIPIRLYKAARRERIRFRRVYRPPVEEPAPTREAIREEPPPPKSKGKIHELPEPMGSPAGPPVVRIRNAPVAEFSEAPVERGDVLKGYEIEKDRYVTFDPGEVAALRPQTSSELAIAEFVRLAEIDPIFFETSYYAAPDAGGEKAYALLFRVLAETGYAAVGDVAMHGREHVAVIRPGRRGLIVHTLFYENEVRADEEYGADAGLAGAKEMELAKQFVQALAAPFDPGKLKDKFEERLRAMVQERAETAAPAPKRGEISKGAPVVDIMEALRKSLEKARKPPLTESARGAAPAKASGTRPRRSRR